MKLVVKRRFRFMPFGTEGAGRDAHEHREAVLAQFASSQVNATTGEGAAKRLQRLHAVRRFPDRVWKDNGVVEHLIV